MIEIKRLGVGDGAEVRRAEHLFDDLRAAAIRGFLVSSTDHLLIAYLDGEPAGALIAHELSRLDGPPNMMLYSIDTGEAFRRRGVARALIEAVKPWRNSADAGRYSSSPTPQTFRQWPFTRLRVADVRLTTT